MGLSITSPEFAAFEAKLKALDLGRIVYAAAEQAAHDAVITDLERAARVAGASPELRSDIGFYQEDGDVRVGVPAGGPSSQEAFDLEYGTAVGAPSGWMRASFARQQREYDDAFGDALTAKLAAGWKA